MHPFCTGHRAFHLLFGQAPAYTDAEDAPAIGAVGQRVSATSRFDGWGYVHLLDARTMSQLDAYAIDEALDPCFAQGGGDLSVHEVAVDPYVNDIAYLSYYSGGLRVIRYDVQFGISEVGAYIAPGGNNFWGVEVHRLPPGPHSTGAETRVLASDRDTGLWIFSYDGDAVDAARSAGDAAQEGTGALDSAVDSALAGISDRAVVEEFQRSYATSVEQYRGAIAAAVSRFEADVRSGRTGNEARNRLIEALDSSRAQLLNRLHAAKDRLNDSLDRSGADAAARDRLNNQLNAAAGDLGNVLEQVKNRFIQASSRAR